MYIYIPPIRLTTLYVFLCIYTLCSHTFLSIHFIFPHSYINVFCHFQKKSAKNYLTFLSDSSSRIVLKVEVGKSYHTIFHPYILHIYIYSLVCLFIFPIARSSNLYFFSPFSFFLPHRNMTNPHFICTYIQNTQTQIKKPGEMFFFFFFQHIGMLYDAMC